MDAVTLHPGTPVEDHWTITHRAHTHCTVCADAAYSAAVYASAVGSNGGTYAPERRAPGGRVIARHSATVTRS